MPRILPILLTLTLTLTACGTTETTIDDDSASNGAIATGPDTGMTTGSGSADTGAAGTDTSDVIPGTNGCELYDPVFWEGAPACPSDCPQEVVATWRGGCLPAAAAIEDLELYSRFRIACTAGILAVPTDVGSGSRVYVFSDGATFVHRNWPDEPVLANIGGELYETEGVYSQLADSCGIVTTTTSP